MTQQNIFLPANQMMASINDSSTINVKITFFYYYRFSIIHLTPTLRSLAWQKCHQCLSIFIVLGNHFQPHTILIKFQSFEKYLLNLLKPYILKLSNKTHIQPYNEKRNNCENIMKSFLKSNYNGFSIDVFLVGVSIVPILQSLSQLV